MRRRITDSQYKAGKEAPAPSAADVLLYLEERFGLERALFSDYGLYATSKGRIYIGPKRLVNHPRIATVGLLIARSQGAIKPSTNLLQLFGRQVKKNYVVLGRENAATFIGGTDVKVTSGEKGDASDGYVLVRYLDFSLGCGMLHGSDVRNMLPKAKRLKIAYI
ncbi:MAG: hypothetical protein PHV13_05075 [Candidatus ainarchaeum sp.]|nr:hypothetical protein [Candidatus ainarchaeum sp.]